MSGNMGGGNKYGNPPLGPYNPQQPLMMGDPRYPPNLRNSGGLLPPNSAVPRGGIMNQPPPRQMPGKGMQGKQKGIMGPPGIMPVPGMPGLVPLPQKPPVAPLQHSSTR
eukprot:TRINITY_DN16854_c0_g1_i1.p1 TRINITY_DN16854_c0_g1~~TRINITY_DN16854_c0_g1_i1.p1  ORF type:complete len:109 (+),score=31.93 TRINITY_DN16854_c0_g1_i1:586-912(+)